MEAVLTEAAKQVPALVVLVAFVVLVLKHLSNKDDRIADDNKSRDEMFLAALKERDERFLEGMKSISDKIDKRTERNTEVIDRNSRVMERVVTVLDRVEARLERHEEEEIRRSAVEASRRT